MYILVDDSHRESIDSNGAVTIYFIRAGMRAMSLSMCVSKGQLITAKYVN